MSQAYAWDAGGSTREEPGRGELFARRKTNGIQALQLMHDEEDERLSWEQKGKFIAEQREKSPKEPSTKKTVTRA